MRELPAVHLEDLHDAALRLAVLAVDLEDLGQVLHAARRARRAGSAPGGSRTGAIRRGCLRGG